jgi:hypothetical protein
MKKLSMILALALAASLAPACSSDDDDGTGDGDGDGDGAGGTGDGDGTGGTGDGDGDGTGGMGGNGDRYLCSDDIWEEPGVPLGGHGGGGGAPAAMCDIPEPPTSIAIAGSYTDDFGGTVEITNEVWDLGYAQFALSHTGSDFALARNVETNLYFPCAWSLFVWTENGGDLYFCQDPYAAESECAAEEADRPDAEDLEMGCAGFPWSKLTPN